MEVPYLRVANVLRDRLALDVIKLIRFTEAELMRTRLLPGDLLIVEGHGNAAEIGRVGVWDGKIESCVHQTTSFARAPIVRCLSPDLPPRTSIRLRVANTCYDAARRRPVSTPSQRPM